MKLGNRNSVFFFGLYTIVVAVLAIAPENRIRAVTGLEKRVCLEFIGDTLIVS